MIHRSFTAGICRGVLKTQTAAIMFVDKRISGRHVHVNYCLSLNKGNGRVDAQWCDRVCQPNYINHVRHDEMAKQWSVTRPGTHSDWLSTLRFLDQWHLFIPQAQYQKNRYAHRLPTILSICQRDKGQSPGDKSFGFCSQSVSGLATGIY